MVRLKIGACEVVWLEGGQFFLDGGPMFGPVPKALWEKRYQADSLNRILLTATPMLVITPTKKILIDTGIGNKLTEKQQKIFAVTRQWDLPAQLQRLGIDPEEIDVVVLTHGDWDHAGGLVMANSAGELVPTFPNAMCVVQEDEWQDITHPGRREASAYWPVNFFDYAASGLLKVIAEPLALTPEVTVKKTGGHTRGHQIVWIESEGETALHPADLVPTHVHYHPLWVMAYDNFPLEVIDAKEELERLMLQKDGWYLFYHDPFCYACRFDADGKVTDMIRREQTD